MFAKMMDEIYKYQIFVKNGNSYKERLWNEKK